MTETTSTISGSTDATGVTEITAVTTLNYVSLNELETNDIEIAGLETENDKETPDVDLPGEPNTAELLAEELIIEPLSGNPIIGDPGTVDTLPVKEPLSAELVTAEPLTEVFFEPTTGGSTAATKTLEDRIKRTPIDKSVVHEHVAKKAGKRKRDLFKRLFRRLRGQYMEPVKEPEVTEIATAVPEEETPVKPRARSFRRASTEDDTVTDTAASDAIKTASAPPVVTSTVGTVDDSLFQKLVLSV